jgi:hypothetical protein
MFDRLGVVIPPQPTKLYGRLRILHTGLMLRAHRYPIVKSWPSRNLTATRRKDLNSVMQITVRIASLQLG